MFMHLPGLGRIALGVAIGLTPTLASATKEATLEFDGRPSPYASTYKALPSGTFALINAHILVGNGQEIANGKLVVSDGKIQAIGTDIALPTDIPVHDLKGQWLTPGLVDVHSHLGVYPAPSLTTSEDGNEMTGPVTAEVWAEHSVWPQDPQFRLALEGGVTTLQILPGSANLIGGRGVTVKNVPALNVQAMKFPGAPYSLKMACGENPKRVYGGNKQPPMTRMGNVAGYRASWIEAQQYVRDWEDYEKKKAQYAKDKKGDEPKEPKRDLRLETLAGVLKGEILVHNHCYRADEMMVMLDIAKEFGYKITAFHHGVEAYKVADKLAENGVCAAIWADWWGFKHEAFDFIRENIALVDRQPKSCAIVHTDSPIGIQHMNQEAAKAMAAGNKMGLSLNPAHAIEWITLNPAKALGIADVTGSLEAGKNADLVVWNQQPLSVYAKAQQVYLDGAKLFDRADKAAQPTSDFDLGIVNPEGERL
ncbi:MAG: amidohydrolase [Gammaproteobacteria bacterium]|nr:amidohydrolase [Gammaproteobacteria bacterium]